MTFSCLACAVIDSFNQRKYTFCGLPICLDGHESINLVHMCVLPPVLD